MISSGDKNKINKPIISSMPIDMMDYLIGDKASIKSLCHNETVFVNIPLCICHWKERAILPKMSYYVAIFSLELSTFPMDTFFSCEMKLLLVASMALFRALIHRLLALWALRASSFQTFALFNRIFTIPFFVVSENTVHTIFSSRTT